VNEHTRKEQPNLIKAELEPPAVLPTKMLAGKLGRAKNPKKWKYPDAPRELSSHWWVSSATNSAKMPIRLSDPNNFLATTSAS